MWSEELRNNENSPDILLDLSSAEMPIKDETVAEVRTSYFLEHCSNFDHLFKEVHRVLLP